VEGQGVLLNINVH